MRHSEIGMTIVITLDKMLAQRKMKSNELAKKIGCSVQTVSRIKTGRIRALRIDTLDIMCEALQCQPGDILLYLDDDEARRLYGEEFIDEYLAFIRS